jgi:hypothetical protein
VTKVAARDMYSVFLGNLAIIAPGVSGVFPQESTCNTAVQHVMVSYDQPVLNVSADDLTLSSGTVISVAGEGRGPYVFSVTGMQLGTINAEIAGDVYGLGGTAAPFSWSFSNRAFAGLTGDCTVDALDFEIFEQCGSGPGIPSPQTAACKTVDFDGDGDVDSIDSAVFQRCWGTADDPVLDCLR